MCLHLVCFHRPPLLNCSTIYRQILLKAIQIQMATKMAKDRKKNEAPETKQPGQLPVRLWGPDSLNVGVLRARACQRPHRARACLTGFNASLPEIVASPETISWVARPQPRPLARLMTATITCTLTVAILTCLNTSCTKTLRKKNEVVKLGMVNRPTKLRPSMISTWRLRQGYSWTGLTNWWERSLIENGSSDWHNFAPKFNQDIN